MMNCMEQGQKMFDIAREIYPLCRSITGNGVRETHKILKKYLPELQTFEIPSGTKVFDWTIPDEWNCKDGYVEDESGKRIIDFKNTNLHIMGYSVPVDEWMFWKELKEHIYTQPEQPNVIPYVTSYYRKRWGFCMSEVQKQALCKLGENKKYHVVIESTLAPGSLTYSECVIPGETEQEILFSTYTCHPSMANNECSGPALSVMLADWVKQEPRKYTYRFVYIPETIGSITYISRNLSHLRDHVIAGINLSCVGDDRNYSFVETRGGDARIDHLMENILYHYTDNRYIRYSFLDRGSDERQYNAPGVDLPVVAFSRSKYGEYPEYHTSADDMTIVSPEGFQGAYDVVTKVLSVLEINDKYKVNVLCEPQLGKRGLYPTVSQKGSYDAVELRVNFLAYADGEHDLIDIAEKIKCSAYDLIEEVGLMMEHGLIGKERYETA